MADNINDTDTETDPQTPEQWSSRWQVEVSAAKKEFEDRKFHQRGEKVEKRLRDDREGTQKEGARLNLASANNITQRAITYGDVPKSDVTRRFGDPNDDVARVAGEMLRRMCNTDIETGEDGYAEAIGNALIDRQGPGFGFSRVRYVLNEQEEGAYRERCEVDYINWRDVLWSAGTRVRSELRWLGMRSQMSRRQLVDTFGEDARNAPLNSQRGDIEKKRQQSTPWARSDVWEIWDKENKCVWWFVEGHSRVLTPVSAKGAANPDGSVPDPLQLDGFWPFAKPMVANRGTESLFPTTDYYLAQDVYIEIDDVTDRIRLLVRALRAVGVYDATHKGLQRMLEEGRGNELIPVENFQRLTEKGGLAGAIDWLPMEQIVNTIAQLRIHRQELVQLEHEVTGHSDIERGQAQAANVTATEQRIKAGFGSVRMRALGLEFANFASDLLRLKAEVIAKHFSPETIIEQSNVMYTADAKRQAPDGRPLPIAAVELLKSRYSCFRIDVKPEAVAMPDFAAQKAEATEFLQSVSGFVAAMAPIAQAMPGSTQYLLQLLQIGVANFRIAGAAEGILDQAIAEATQASQNPQAKPEDPKAKAEQAKVLQLQIKGQADIQKTQLEHKNRLEEIAAETQADDMREASQMQWNVREAAMKHAIAPPKPVRPYGGAP